MEYLLKSLNSFLVILIVGSLVLLSFLLISNLLKVNRKANIFFGGFLLLWAVFWVEEILTLINLEVNAPIFDGILGVSQFFVSILFYYGVLYFTNPYRKCGKVDFLHFVVPFLWVLGFIYKLGIDPNFNWNGTVVFGLLFQALLYTIGSLVLLLKHEKRIEFFNSNREAVDLRWIKQIIVSLVVICVFITIYNMVLPKGNLNILANSLTLAIIFFIAYHAMGQKEIFILGKEEIEQIFQEAKEEGYVKQKLLTDGEVATLKNKLIVLMEDEKPYLEGDISLLKLAGLMNLSAHHLSYLLNAGFGKNFFQFVNTYRVEESKKLLLSKDYEHLSIIGIAYDSGFNSKTAFNTVFKKHTGMTPSAFKKNSSFG